MSLQNIQLVRDLAHLAVLPVRALGFPQDSLGVKSSVSSLFGFSY